MKYIVTKTEDGTEEIFLFPKSVNHKMFSESVYAIKDQSYGNWKRIRREVVSAGFIEGGRCTGYSESLGIGSREQDTSFLTNQ